MITIPEVVADNTYSKIDNAIKFQGYSSIKAFFEEKADSLDISYATYRWNKSHKRILTLNSLYIFSILLDLPLDYLLGTKYGLTDEDYEILKILKGADDKSKQFVLSFLKESKYWKS